MWMENKILKNIFKGKMETDNKNGTFEAFKLGLLLIVLAKVNILLTAKKMF